MANVFSAADIVSEFGKLFIDGGQSKKDLIMGLMQAPKTLVMAGMKQIKMDNTVYRLANPIITNFLQPYQAGFTPKGSVDFHPNEIAMKQCKVDVEIHPEEIEESWLGFLAGKSSEDLEKWPITIYIAQLVRDNVAKEKEVFCSYLGQYQQPVIGTAGEAINCFDGLKKQLLDGVKSDYPVHIIEGMGELNTDDVFDQIEYFYAHLPEVYRREGMPIFISDDMLLAYLKTKRERGFYSIKDDGGISTRVDFGRSTIFSLPSMAGTTDIFTTLPSNIVHLTKRDLNMTNFDVQKVDRIVKLLVDWWEGVGFACNDYVFTNRATVKDSCVADPVITASGTSVTMSTATAGATIRYTTDGSEPTSTSTAYSSTITIEADTTFVAKAFKEGLVSSRAVKKTVELSE